MRLGKIAATVAVLVAAAVPVHPSCCTDSSGAPLVPYDNCSNYSEMTCGSSGGRCGESRQNWCSSPPGCGDACRTLSILVLVDMSSPCACEDEEAGCLCELSYSYIHAFQVACDLS